MNYWITSMVQKKRTKQQEEEMKLRHEFRRKRKEALEALEKEIEKDEQDEQDSGTRYGGNNL